jgi:hypothetical protein
MGQRNFSRTSAGVRSSIAGAALDAERLGTEIGRKTPEERAVQVREAENAAASDARAPFEQIHSAAALIAVRGQIGIAEDAEFCHQRERGRTTGRPSFAVQRVDARIGVWQRASRERCATRREMQSAG